MARKLKEHRPVGEEFLAGAAAPLTYDLNVPARAVWAAMVDGPAWSEWLPISRVTWTSPQPFGIGTTRTVEIDRMEVQETFFAWDEGRRMAFRFDRSSFPVRAAVEDYRVIDRGEYCTFEWRGRVDGVFPIGWLLGTQLRKGIRKGLPKLERLIRDNPQRFGL